MSVMTAVARPMSEKEMTRIIRDCDVADTVMRADSPEAFWTLLRMTNDQYRKTAKSLRSGGDRDIKRNLLITLSECDSYFRNVPVRSPLYDLCERTADAIGVRGINPLATVTITDERDIAAFSYPNGYLFATGALYDALGGDSLQLRCILASEACHYALQHAYAHARYEKSRRRLHRFLRILGATALAGASVVAQEATDGWFPAEVGILAAAYIGTSPVIDRYRMQYTPRQILEADIVAYRYAQYTTGSGRPYIAALITVGNDLDASSNLTGPDYPTVAERIKLLLYMEAHPELRRRAKSNRRPPRPAPDYNDIFAPSNYR